MNWSQQFPSNIPQMAEWIINEQPLRRDYHTVKLIHT